MSQPLDTLAARISVPSRQLAAPGPDPETLAKMLQLAIRVPDHGKLEPWRFITLEGENKLAFGEKLAQLAAQKNPDMPDSKKTKERMRYTFAPLVVAVIARIDHAHKVPAQEQLLSAGCVAYNLLLAAQGFGFGAQWLTNWAAYDEGVKRILGLTDNESVTGFIHIGTAKREIPDHHRPDIEDLVSAWQAP